MTSTPQKKQSAADQQSAAETNVAAKESQAHRLQDDPRAQAALAKKNHAANPTAASGAAHIKAAHESSKQGKKEKKVRW
ncbi:hypothetical protein [Arthrobacter agilis]|jgi:hypothetical protein|uniref:hypothetical protein n=1 Tax=Arthrobacter agilis TaxID=37921 RepID=UPI00278280C2|nr:hypothetical protein [Arthrobacter agilis]MDQ0736787.1 hypothetical protein [Arthrobacter agilis]